MSEDAANPEILQAEWDRQQVGALFDDLAKGAEVKHVQVRGNSNDRVDNSQVTLSDARQLFDDGHAKAIQIRYVFEDQSWCDTLMIGPTLTRIIRTREG